MTWAAGWRLAVGTLTVLPVRPPSRIDREVAGRAMVLAPLAVLPLAVIAAALARLVASIGWPSALSGVVLVGCLAVGTRALHLDGLADTVDGLGSGRDAEGALAIMRRGDVGPMGVVALVLVLGAQALAASTLTGSWSTAALLALVIAASRSTLVLACRAGIPAARPGGLGAMVAGTVSPAAALLAGIGVAVAVIGLAATVGRPWWAGLVAVVAAALVAYGIVRRCVRRLGGITGDVLGAMVELSLLVLLLGASLG